MENPSAMEGAVYMNCILRKWRLSDAKDLAAALNNKKILNNLRDGLPYPYTEQDARDYICTMLSSDEKSTFAYAITQNDRAIGSIGAFRKSNIHRQTAELGYYLAEEYWGQGIMTESIRQLCSIIFAALGEEIAFRGFFVGKGMKRFPFWLCTVVSSVAFAAGHIAVGNAGLVAYDIATVFIDSMIYAMVYRRSGNCLMSTISHTLCNAVAIAATLLFF